MKATFLPRLEENKKGFCGRTKAFNMEVVVDGPSYFSRFVLCPGCYDEFSSFLDERVWAWGESLGTKRISALIKSATELEILKKNNPIFVSFKVLLFGKRPVGTSCVRIYSQLSDSITWGNLRVKKSRTHKITHALPLIWLLIKDKNLLIISALC